MPLLSHSSSFLPLYLSSYSRVSPEWRSPKVVFSSPPLRPSSKNSRKALTSFLGPLGRRTTEGQTFPDSIPGFCWLSPRASWHLQPCPFSLSLLLVMATAGEGKVQAKKGGGWKSTFISFSCGDLWECDVGRRSNNSGVTRRASANTVVLSSFFARRSNNNRRWGGREKGGTRSRHAKKNSVGRRRSVSRGNKNRLCSKTCGGYEILVTKVIRKNLFNISEIEQQLDQECWIPPQRDFIERKSSKRKMGE